MKTAESYLNGRKFALHLIFSKDYIVERMKQYASDVCIDLYSKISDGEIKSLTDLNNYILKLK